MIESDIVIKLSHHFYSLWEFLYPQEDDEHSGS